MPYPPTPCVVGMPYPPPLVCLWQNHDKSSEGSSKSSDATAHTMSLRDRTTLASDTNVDSDVSDDLSDGGVVRPSQIPFDLKNCGEKKLTYGIRKGLPPPSLEELQQLCDHHHLPCGGTPADLRKRLVVFKQPRRAPSPPARRRPTPPLPSTPLPAPPHPSPAERGRMPTNITPV